MVTKYISTLAVALVVSLGLITPSLAGKFTYAIEACKSYKSDVICTAIMEPTTLGEIASMASSFEEFRKLNNLPASAMPHTPAPAYKMFAYRKRDI